SAGNRSPQRAASIRTKNENQPCTRRTNARARSTERKAATRPQQLLLRRKLEACHATAVPRRIAQIRRSTRRIQRRHFGKANEHLRLLPPLHRKKLQGWDGKLDARQVPT